MELCRSAKISLRTWARTLCWTKSNVVQVRPAETTNIEMRNLVRNCTLAKLCLSVFQQQLNTSFIRAQTYNLSHAPCGSALDSPNPFLIFASASGYGYRWFAWTDNSGIPAPGAGRRAK